MSLVLQDISKAFGPIVADAAASLDVAAGEIHALVGENGAGKSTLMRIACGLIAPDAGRVVFEGRDVTGWSVGEAIAAGIGMVHQHFMLVPTLTVAENVVLGDEPPGRDFERVVAAFAERVGLEVPVSRRMGSCSVGEAQRVEILKVLYRGARVLVLDEPTAVLTPPEVGRLWEVLRAHRAGGGTVVLITHKLDEVMAVSDRVTVMRGGRTVASMPTASATPAELVRAMVGRDLVLPMPTTQEVRAGEPVLEVDGMFAVRAGEIFGIAGVEGNGQTELIETIAGLRDGDMVVRVAGERVDQLSVRARRELGVRHIPEDRQRRGLVLDFSIADNLALGTAPGWAGGAIAEFDIRPTDPRTPARALSGGNQQKVVVAREMAVDRPYTVLLAAHPTRGVDVGAVEIIHRHLRAARSAGRAIVMVSTELNELIALADRIAVMLRGRFVAVLLRGEATVERLGQLMTGATA